MRCGSLNTIAFSTNTTTQGDDLYLDQITVTCIPGYEQNGGDLVRKCTSAGTWDGMAPTCASELPVLNVKADGHRLKWCAPGYSMFSFTKPLEVKISLWICVQISMLLP